MSSEVLFDFTRHPNVYSAFEPRPSHHRIPPQPHRSIPKRHAMQWYNAMMPQGTPNDEPNPVGLVMQVISREMTYPIYPPTELEKV